MKAKAVVFTGPSTVAFGEVICPDPGDHDVVVQVGTSWISNGTEGSFLRGERTDGDVAYKEGHPRPFPIVAGYQKVGVVSHVGKSVARFQEGDRVFATVGRVDGMFKDYGGQLSPSVSNERELWKIPAEEETGVPADAYAGLVLTQVGYNCGARPPADIGSVAVVLGAGLVGQWAAQTLWWRGARVILLGHHDHRLQRFAPKGNCRAGRTSINTRSEIWKNELSTALAGTPVDVLVDTVGSVPSRLRGPGRSSKVSPTTCSAYSSIGRNSSEATRLQESREGRF